MIWTALLGLAWAARIAVDADGGRDFTDLPDAVAAAQPGDYIAVYPGTYSAITLTQQRIPIVGLGGSALTVIDDPTASWAVTGPTGGWTHLEGFTLAGGSGGGVSSITGLALLRDVHVLGGATGVDLNPAGVMQAEGLLVAGTTTGIATSSVSPSMRVSADGLTLVDNGTHLDGAARTSLQHLIAAGGAYDACAATATYGLITDYGTLPSCVQLSAVSLDLDPGFAVYSDDGDPWNDDFSLAAGSPALDTGDPACFDADGSVCDLGFTGGPLGGRTDADQDGQPDAWEAEVGLDPQVDDGALDEDGDGLDNLAEYLFSSDPWSVDTDQDGEDDGSEVLADRDPADAADNAPTAVASVIGRLLGDVFQLDGSASSDPTGDPLQFTWTLLAAPAGSNLGPALGHDMVQTVSPDLAGAYVVALVVSDGYSTSRTLVTLFAAPAEGIRIPEDFARFEDALPHLQDGMTVRFGEGSFEIATPLPFDLILRGAGPDLTVLTGPANVLALDDQRLSASDLSVEATGSARALQATGQSLVQLRDVALRSDQGEAVAVRDSALVGWGLRIEAEQSRAMLVESAFIALASSRVSSGTSDAIGSTEGLLTLDGVLLLGGVHGLRAQQTAVDLKHVTIRAEDTGLFTSDPALTTGRNIVIFSSPTGIRCGANEEAGVDHLLLSSVPAPSSGCLPMTHVAFESEGVDADGLPRAGSIARDGGDSWLVDPDGTRSDLGYTGGAFGLGYPLGLATPDADADGDGLSATSERVLASLDDALDSDGDGVGDRQELLDATHPARSADHLPQPDPALVARLEPGDSFALDVPFGPDPDGDACDFAWDDGSAQPRAADTRQPGLRTLGWTLRCGEGVARGTYTVIVQEHIAVSPETWEARLATAPPYALLELEAGEYPTPSALPAKPIALRGVGPETRILGDLHLEAPHAFVRDLRVEGDLRVQGEVVATEVWGALMAVKSSVRSTRVVGGPLDASSGSELRYAAVSGELLVDQGSTFCSAATADPRVAATRSTLTLRVRDDEFLFVDEDPGLTVLEPWPGSLLWTACTPESPEGSDAPYDIGATGGPEAWPTDADGDDLNDAWERFHATDEPTLDPDGDGLDNLAEFTIGTDPNDPDTDDDRLPDGADPHPLGSEGDLGIQPHLEVTDHFPFPGEEIRLSSADSFDEAGQALRTTWRVYDPDGVEWFVGSGESVTVPIERQGAWRIRMELQTEDGLTAALEDTVYGRREVQVPEGTALADAVASAEPGDALVLADARIDGDVEIRVPIVLTGAKGATHSRVDGPEWLAAITVEGVRVRLEGIAVHASDDGVGVHVVEGALELRQALVAGGARSMAASWSSVEIKNSAILGGQSLISAYHSDVRVVNGVIGWVPSDGIALHLTGDSSLVADATILSLARDADPYFLSGSTLTVRHCLFTDWIIRGDFPVSALGSVQGDARFLLDPAEAEGWLAADLRLNGSSDAADWTSLEQRDLDGSALDLGVFGGPLGDWRDVDNDRDGYDNLEGDCDDFDPAIVPEGVGGSCPTAEGCRGCANGAGGGTALAALLALALTRRQDRRAQPSTPSPDRSSGGTGRGCEAWPLESARRRGARPGRRET